jgi:hypothetical protein
MEVALTDTGDNTILLATPRDDVLMLVGSTYAHCSTQHDVSYVHTSTAEHQSNEYYEVTPYSWLAPRDDDLQ